MVELPRFLRLALRSLRRSPGFSLTVLGVLTLTLGALVAVLSLVEAVVLAPLPYPQAERLVVLWDTLREDPQPRRVSGFNAQRFQELPELDQVAVFGWASSALTGAGPPVQISGSRVSRGFFDILSLPPLHGRALGPEDYLPSAPPAVVVSHRLWSRHLGGDPSWIGRPLFLDGEAHILVGVLPPRLMPLRASHGRRLEVASREAHFWVPLPQIPERHNHVYGALGRLAPGITPEGAQVRLSALAQRLAKDHPETHRDADVHLVTLREEVVGGARPGLGLLLGGVLFLCLLATANLTNLFLVRSTAKRRELAVCTALGASRWRLLAQPLCEVLLLGSAGLILGSLGGAALVRFLGQRGAGGLPRIEEASLSPWVMSLAALAGAGMLLAVILLALRGVPRGRPEGALEDSVRQAGDRRGQRLQRLLVTVQAGLAVVLLSGSGLLLESYLALRLVDPGFDPHSVLTFGLYPNPEAYPERADLTSFYRRLSEDLEELPGVSSVALAYDLPLEANWTQSFELEGIAPGHGPGERQAALFRTVSPGYFETLGIGIQEGEPLRRAGEAGALGTAVINRAFADAFLGDRPALGQLLRVRTTQWRWGEGNVPDAFRIIGVVDDVRAQGLRGGTVPAFYLPFEQTPHPSMKVLVRTHRPPKDLLPRVEARVHALDPSLPLSRARTVVEQIDGETARPRLHAGLLGSFSLGALGMAALGLWGILSYSLLLRTREIGIRTALGADRARLSAWVFGLGLRPVLWGVALGLPCALLLGRSLEDLLFEVRGSDPVSGLRAAAALLAVAALATWVHARRASSLEPVAALRDGTGSGRFGK